MKKVRIDVNKKEHDEKETDPALVPKALKPVELQSEQAPKLTERPLIND